MLIACHVFNTCLRNRNVKKSLENNHKTIEDTKPLRSQLLWESDPGGGASVIAWICFRFLDCLTWLLSKGSFVFLRISVFPAVWTASQPWQPRQHSHRSHSSRSSHSNHSTYSHSRRSRRRYINAYVDSLTYQW